MNQRNRKGNKKYEIEIFVDKIEGTGERARASDLSQDSRIVIGVLTNSTTIAILPI